MKNFVRSGSVLLALLCPVVVAGRASALVVWTAGFESDKSGDVCASTDVGAEFTPGAIVMEGTRIDAEVLGEQVYAGKLACKVTVHPDDIFGQYKQDRVDVKHNSTLTGEGKDMYLSGFYYLPQDAQTPEEFGMFETTNSLNWFDIRIEPKKGSTGTSIVVGIESNGADLGSVPIWNGDFTAGKWHQIALHIHWSQDATKGLVDFWLDGQQVVTGFKHKTKPNANDLYFLTGLHRVLMQPYTESIYFDDFIEADTQDEIKIGAPTNGGGSSPDGGVDASGAGGAGSAGTGGAAGTAGAAGAAGTAGSGGSAGTAGSTGAAGSNSTGAAGASSTGAAGAGGTTSGTAGIGASTGAGGTTGAGGSRAKSSGGCAIGGATTTEALTSGLALLCALVIARRARRR